MDVVGAKIAALASTVGVVDLQTSHMKLGSVILLVKEIFDRRCTDHSVQGEVLDSLRVATRLACFWFAWGWAVALNTSMPNENRTSDQRDGVCGDDEIYP